MNTRPTTILAVLFLSGVLAGADTNMTGVAGAAAPDSAVSQSLANEARAAIDRGTKWLLALQNPDGYWSSPDFPALTALPLWAIVQSGTQETQAAARAADYILSCVHEDGSIWREPKVSQKGGGLSNYNTALCMVALHALGDARFVPVIQNARRFIAGTQHFGDDEYRGGMGYDPKTGRPYADLSNSYLAYESMRLTENVEDLRKAGDKRADLDWKAAEQFLNRVQNRKDSNDLSWPSDDPDSQGGFIYKPDASQAGTYTDQVGVVRFRTYGSMTYAGLLSFIYAEVDRNDPRVQSAFEWACRHWTLEENPGIGQEGLYYFYQTLAKALAVFGRNQLPLPAGGVVNWREELIRKLISLQKTDPATGNGYWVNENGRWWESDPVLVTSYSLLALEIALK